MNSTMSMSACVVEDMGKLFQIGQEQYKLYKETRFVTGVADVLDTTIKTNQLKLPKDVQKLTPLSSSDEIKLRNGCSFIPEVAGELLSFVFTVAPDK